MDTHQFVVDLHGRHRSAIGDLMLREEGYHLGEPAARLLQEERMQIGNGGDAEVLALQISGAQFRVVLAQPPRQAVIRQLGILIRPRTHQGPQADLIA